MGSQEPAPRVVAVTGAASGLGRELAARLARSRDVRRVVAVDGTHGDLTDVTWRVADVRDPALASRLDGVDVVVHLAVETGLEAPADERRALNVRGTANVLAAAPSAGVRAVVLVTSAMVYGALPDNPVPLREDAPLRATPESSLPGDWLEMERLARQATRGHPALTVTVLRPAPLVGPAVDSVFTRHFEAPRLLVLRGAGPLWQFCHVDDLLSALELAAAERLRGRVNVACDGWLSQADVERISGLRPLSLPPAVAFAAAERLHRAGVTLAPASELLYLSHPWVVGNDRLRRAGWVPAYDNESALRAQLANAPDRLVIGTRAIHARDATRAAAGAGATVAVVGTILVARARAARRHRR